MQNPPPIPTTDAAKAARDAIRMTIKQGCILWKKRDFVGCTSLYRSLATSYAREYPVLAEALISCENAPLDNGSSQSQGWILRRAMDTILASAPPLPSSPAPIPP